METFIQDLRYGIKALLKRPVFSLVALITLALGIGANSAIFSVVNGVLLRSLPFKNPDRLVMVWERRTNSHAANLPVSGHEFVAWKERSHSFDGLALVQPDGLNLTGRGDPVTVSAAQVSGDFFTVIGVAPLLGRAFSPDEDRGKSQAVILGHKLWQQRFGSDQNVVGQGITLNNQNYVVAGVLPPLELMPEVLLPMNLPDEARMVGKHSHQVMGRLKPGVTLEEAQTELAYVSQQLEKEQPGTNTGHGVQLVSLHEETVGNVRPALLVLFGAVAFVLLIACANVTNLLLTRAAGRQKEMAIRTALGAARWRLVRQMLIESLLLSCAGGALGLLAAVWLIEFIPKLEVLGVPRVDQVKLDLNVLAATVGFSIFAGLIAGIAPAWRHSGPNLSRWMNEGARGTGSSDRRSLGNVLVVAEVALALTLLVGGGLMLKSFVTLLKVDPGFDPHQVLRLDLALAAARYPEARQQLAFYQELIERLRTLPGVESVGATTQTPLNPGDNWSPFVIEGRPEPPAGQRQQAAMRSVTDDYFRTMKIPLRRGRFFSQNDERKALPVMRWYDKQPYPEHYDESQPVPTVIINDTMARLYWPNEDPLGRRLKIIASPWLTIVGVVGDVHHSGLSAQANPEMYLSDRQEPSNSLAVMARTTGDPLQLAGAAREQVRALDKEQPLTVGTMEQIFSQSVAGQRFNTFLLGLFGGLALLLSMVGVFGVVNYSVTQRTHEIGIRLALGAQRRNIFRMIVSQGLALTLIGVAIGCAGAFGLTRLLVGLLYGVSPTDLPTFVAVSLLLTLVTLIACYIPARRATKVDPLVALRYE